MKAEFRTDRDKDELALRAAVKWHNSRKMEPEARRTEFRTDNTEGYDETDLKNLNAAWDEITGHGAPTDSDDIGAQSMLQHWSEKLLSEYDAGKRGERLTAWFYA